MIYFKISFVLSAILVLFLCNSKSVVTSVDNNINNVTNEIWSKNSIVRYQATIHSSNKDKKIVPLKSKPKKIFPKDIADFSADTKYNSIITFDLASTVSPLTTKLSSQALFRPITPYNHGFTINEDYVTEDEYYQKSCGNCKQQLKNSECIYRNGIVKCICPNDYIKYKNVCVDSGEYHQKICRNCKEHLKNSECIYENGIVKCVCPNDYINYENECVDTGEFHQKICRNCKEHLKNSECIYENGIVKCVCPNDYINYENECVDTVEYNWRKCRNCNLELKNSECVYRKGIVDCICPRDHVKFGNECLNKAQHGEYCKHSAQCITSFSICYYGFCRCLSGYILCQNHCATECVKKDKPELWPYLIIGFVVVSVTSALVMIGVWFVKRMKNRRARTHHSSERRPRTISETCTEYVDKPPDYDEAISVSTTTLALSIEELSRMPPPNYEAVLRNQQ